LRLTNEFIRLMVKTREGNTNGLGICELS